MLNHSKEAWLQKRLSQDAERRAIKKLAKTIAQEILLDLNNPDLELSNPLSQPISCSKKDALERWVQGQLSIQEVHADEADVEQLCKNLKDCLTARES